MTSKTFVRAARSALQCGSPKTNMIVKLSYRPILPLEELNPSTNQKVTTFSPKRESPTVR